MQKYLILFIVVLASCNSTKPYLEIEKPTVTVTPQVISLEQLHTRVQRTSKDIKKIQKNTKDLVTKNQINNTAEDVDEYAITIKTITNDLKKVEKGLKYFLQEVQEYRSGMKQKQLKIWYILLTGCGTFLVFGVIMLVAGSPKIGVMAIVSSLAISLISYGFIQYVEIIGKVGLGIIFLILGSIGYQVFVHKRTIQEVVMGNQLTKDDSWKNTQKTFRTFLSNSSKKEIKKITKGIK